VLTPALSFRHCAYLWAVVRDHRPLGVAAAGNWMHGSDAVDLFLYGDTIIMALQVTMMLGSWRCFWRCFWRW